MGLETKSQRRALATLLLTLGVSVQVILVEHLMLSACLKQAFTVNIGGSPIAADFIGLTPGLVGLFQINIRVPALPAGNYSLSVSGGNTQSNEPVIMIGGQQSGN